VKHVPLRVIEDMIVRPGFDERLRPPLAYRGAMTLGRVHRLWNLIVSAMAHFCGTVCLGKWVSEKYPDAVANYDKRAADAIARRK
jgi:hypothetical protein